MKKQIKKIIFLLSIIILIQDNYAQGFNAKDILEKVTNTYRSKESYKIDVTYAMHRGFTGTVITESYSGSIAKNRGISQFKVLGNEIIRYPGVELSFDHSDKNLYYKKVKEGSIENSPVDLETYFNLYDKVQVAEKENNWIIEMVSAKPSMQNPYGKVVLYIHKKTYHIEKQELFFSTMIPFVDAKTNSRNMDYGRLVILLKHNSAKNIELPGIGEFVHFSDNGQILLTEQYKGYKLIKEAN